MKTMELRNIPQIDYAVNEAVNSLASNIIFSGSQFHTIMMTSCEANEGKSFVTFQLAQRLAGLGYSVALVDADLRKSVFMTRYDAFAQEPVQGLTHYLAGRCTADQIEYQTNIPNLHMVPSGKTVINSLPLLTSPNFAALLQDLAARYHFVLVDAPPVGVIIDAAMIASVCDATLFTVTNEKVSRRALKAAVQQIQKTNCTVLGVVLNKVALDNRKSKNYYYKSYYGHYGSGEYYTDSSKKRKSKKVKQAAEKANPTHHTPQVQK